MRAKVYSQTPPALVVLAITFILSVLLGRESSVMEDFPAFLPLNDNYLHVEVTGAIATPGVYQFNDGLALLDVIKMTHGRSPQDLLLDPTWSWSLQDGESIEIIAKNQNLALLRRGWMPASHRVSMGIPLHPDRMSYADWQFLPGIGGALANSIEENRQRNGDFVGLDGLLRVKGIGLKSVDKWRDFFAGM